MKFKVFLEMSHNKYAQFLSACALKQALEDNWSKVPYFMKVKLTEYLVLTFQNQIVLVRDPQVVSMMTLILAKLVKLSWFDECPEQQLLRRITTDMREIAEQVSPS